MIRRKARPGPREPSFPASLGPPRPLAKGKPTPGLCAKKWPLRKRVLCSGEERLQSSLCVEFLSL